MSAIEIRQTDWRRALRVLPAGEVLIAIGDVHGQAHLLDALHAAIRADLAAFAFDRATVVHVGDLIDRGRRNRDAIDLARSGLAGDRIELVTLRGNHDSMLLDVVNGTGYYGTLTWLLNGGDMVLEELGIDMRIEAGAIGDALGRERVAWLESLPLTHRVRDYLLVHAGINPRRPLTEQDPEELVWIRGPFLQFRGPFPEGLAVIHGHTPAPIPTFHPHRINVDTGAFFSGILTAAEIVEDRMRLVHAVGEPDSDRYQR